MSDLEERLSAVLAGRYTIERELGRGGMAVVYLAQDEKLHRQVALKVLRPELAASLGSERFLREIEIAAKLTHPNILALYDCGEADGQLYYTMPYVEGESLRDRLNREKQLSIEDALQITREVADALGYAHELGIIHRDIKPENTLFQSGHALVADFGIARALSAAGAETLTETGLAVGTPAYMSPEQGVGSGELDGRSDLYSLGCVLYEMLTGETPYLGNTPQAIIAKKLSEPLPRISVVRETVPKPIEAALTKTLARTPADRFATAQQFSEALRQTMRPTQPRKRNVRRLAATLGVIGLAVVASGAYGAWWFFATGRPGTVFATGMLDPGDRVLLADFDNRTDDSTLGFAVQEALHIDLADANVVRLVDRAGVRASLERMGLPTDTRLVDEEVTREVAERENAKAFIAGEITQIGVAYQVTARVIASTDGTELRSIGERAHNLDDLIDAIGRLGGRLRNAIGESVRSRVAHPPLAQVSTGSLQALRAYSEAQRLHVNYLEDTEAVALLDQAISLDSGFAMAYYLQSAFLRNLGRVPEARMAAERAHQHRERLPEWERLWVTAHYNYTVLWNPEVADAVFRQLLSLRPRDPEVLRNYADLRLAERRWTEAESLAVAALELKDPGTVAYQNAAEAMVAQGRFAAADSVLDRMMLDGYGGWELHKFRALVAQRQYAAALALNDSMLRATGDPAEPEAWRLLGIQGKMEAAQQSGGRSTMSLWRASWAKRWLGDTAEAGRQLEQWLEESDWDTTTVEARNYQDVIPSLAEIGRIREAKRLYAEWGAVGDANAYYASDHLESLAYIAASEGHLDSATTLFLRWHAAPFADVGYVWNRGLVEAATILDRADNPDSAIVLYEKALALPSMYAMYYEEDWYPLVLRRLGELHESLGHREEAVEYYGKFIDLWKDADPELQPQVEAARAALIRFTGEPRGDS